MVCNHWVTWILIKWSRGKLKILYHNFYKGHNHQTWLEHMWEQNGTIAICHEVCDISFIVFLHFIHSATSMKTIITNLGGNKHQNEMVVYLHVTWANHPKLFKTTAPKVALMKGTYLNRPHDLWLHENLTKIKSMW